MKKYLTVLLALFALPVLAQVGGFTKMGTYHPLYQGGDPPVVLWAGYTNNIDSVLTTGDDSGGEFAIISLKTLTNFPPFAPDSLDMKYGTYYGTNGVDFPFGAQTWNVNVGVHLTNNPGWMIQEYNDASTLPIRLTTAVPKIYFMSFVATVGGWGGGSNTTMYYQTNCYGCQTATPGLLEWVKTASAVGGNAPVNSVAVDSSGNVYATGYFTGSVEFGLGRSNSFPNATSGNIFLAKYSSAGVLTWLKIIATTNTVGAANEVGRGVAVDGSGNVIITGGFANTVDFSGSGAVGATLTSLANENVYVAKYQADGTFVWAKRFGGSYSDAGYCVAVDSNNDVYMGGRMTSVNADYGGVTISCPGSQGICVAKLSGTDGTTIWAKGLGGAAYNQLQGLAVATNGDVCITGYFFSGSSSLGGITLTNAGASDIFLGRLESATGNCVWSKRLGSTKGDSGVGVAADPITGNVILTGSYNGVVNFGGGDLDTYNDGGIVLASYAAATGNYLWAIATGGGGDAGMSVTIDSSGNLLLAGKASSAINFGVWPQDPWLIGDGQPNVILGAFTLSGNLAPVYRWAKVVGQLSTGASSPTSVALDTTGHVFVGGSFISLIDFGGITATAGAPGYSSGFLNRYVR